MTPRGAATLESPVGDTPTDGRSSRRASRSRRRVRRRFWLIALPLAAIIVAGVVVAGNALRSTPAERRSLPASATTTTATPSTTELPSSVAVQTVVLAHQRSTGALDFTAVVTGGGSPAFGRVTIVPAAAKLALPARGTVAAADVASADSTAGPGDTDFVKFAYESVLGLRVDQVALLDDVALRSVLDAAGALTVRTPEAKVLSPADAFAVLSADAPDPTRVEGVVAALLVTMRDPAKSSAVLDVSPPLGPLVVAASARAEVVTVTPPANGAVLDFNAIGPAISGIPNDARLGVNGLRPSVGLRDGVGDRARVDRAVRCIVAGGGEVKKVDAVPAYQFDKTAITYADDTKREAAQQLRDALGIGAVAPQAGGANSFDVTVFIGADFESCPQ